MSLGTVTFDIVFKLSKVTVPNDRDNTTGDEVDSILEFRDGSYAAIEIKLSEGSIADAKKSLMTFYNNVNKKPEFMCIIVGHYEAVIRDKETGIYIIPITSLRP